MTEVVDATGDGRDEAVAAAVAALRRGALAVLPTDTVYGVAADAFDRTATAAVFRAKDRPRTAPLPVLVRGPKQVIGLVTIVPAAAERLMAAYWPGPLTLVVASDPNLAWDLGESQGTVALRMPLDDVALAVIRAIGPLAVTSANRTGAPPARTAARAHEALGDHVDVYVDDGPRDEVAPSTIVDLTRAEPHVLREGSVPADEALGVASGRLDPHEVTAPGTPPDDLDDTTSG